MLEGLAWPVARLGSCEDSFPVKLAWGKPGFVPSWWEGDCSGKKGRGDGGGLECCEGPCAVTRWLKSKGEEFRK